MAFAISIPSFFAPNCCCLLRPNFRQSLRLLNPKPRRRFRRQLTSVAAMFSENVVVSDIVATGLSGGIALSLFKIWEQTAKRGLFDQKLNRKLVHVTLGLAFMLCWPMFSTGRQGAILAALIPGLNIIKMLLLGLGVIKDEAAVKSMSRFGDHRELLKGPLYYASTITLASAIYWRTSPIAIAAVCNLCAGDGMADIVGRRFGSEKLPYNNNKSIIGSITMACAGFLASVGYMFYFSSFGYMQESWEMVVGFLVVSIATALVFGYGAVRLSLNLAGALPAFPSPLNRIEWADKKGAGSTKNGRDLPGQRLGIKIKSPSLAPLSFASAAL